MAVYCRKIELFHSWIIYFMMVWKRAYFFFSGIPTSHKEINMHVNYKYENRLSGIKKDHSKSHGNSFLSQASQRNHQRGVQKFMLNKMSTLFILASKGDHLIWLWRLVNRPKNIYMIKQFRLKVPIKVLQNGCTFNEDKNKLA